MHFTVGHKQNNRTQHVIVEAQDALAAALQVKAQCPEAAISYVRPTNKRGDTRHPGHSLNEAPIAQ